MRKKSTRVLPKRGHNAPAAYPDRAPPGAPFETTPPDDLDSHALRAREQKGRPGLRRVDPKTAPPKR